MNSNALPIQRRIDVTVNLTPNGAQIQNINTLLILGASNIIDVIQRYRVYTTLAQVATDFGTSAPEYLAAVLWFEQNPQPTSLQIGCWASAATEGILQGSPLSAAQQALANFTAITSGGLVITLAGTTYTIATFSLAAATSLNNVAAIIQAELITLGAAGAVCQWNAQYQQFFIQGGGTAGTASTITFATGTIAAAMGLLSTSSGAYLAQGIAAETALSCVTLFDANYGQNWYAVTVLAATDNDILAIAAYIDGATNKHLLGVTSQESGIISSVDTSDIAYELMQFGYLRTMTQYSSSNPYAVVSLLAKALTIDYNANNSVITLFYKQEPGIVPENLNTTQITALEAKNCNVFVAYNNNTAIIEPGVMASGNFIDVVTGTDWLALTIQTAVYNLLYTSPTKVPQTDAGNNQIVNTIEQVLAQGDINDLLAPGTWQSQGFGSLNIGDFMPTGYYVYAPPIASQAQNLRAARVSIPFQIACKLAGAIQEVSISILVNQ